MALQFLCPCFILVFRPLGGAVKKTAACFGGRNAKAVVVVVVHVGLGSTEQNPAQCVDVSYQCLCRVHGITLTAVDLTFGKINVTLGILDGDHDAMLMNIKIGSTRVGHGG